MKEKEGGSAALAFEAMDAQGRYLIAEEASEFAGLTDLTEGEMLDERHVVVYKAGHLPEDDCPPTRLAVAKANSSAPQPPPSTAAPRRKRQAPPTEDLHTLNQNKRDRRTIEEIQRERKRLREGGGGAR